VVTDWLFYLPAALAFAAVSFGTLSIVFLTEGLNSIARRRRILARLNPPDREREKPSGEILRASSTQTGLDAALGRLPFFSTLTLRLKQAGLGISALSFFILCAGSAAAFGLLIGMASRSTLFGVVAAALASLLPGLWLSMLRKQRRHAFEAQFPEAIDLLGRAIRAGHPLSAGIRMVADEAPEPTSGEFRQVFEEQRFGLPFEDALLGLSDRNDLVDVRIFATAVLIQREVGGNLAEILDKIAQTVRARFTIRRQIRIYTAQGRLSGYVLGILPIALAVVIYVLDPTYTRLLVEEQAGRMMVGAAVGLQILGFLWIRRVVDIEY
jgi:tight adherence protein B